MNSALQGFQNMLSILKVDGFSLLNQHAYYSPRPTPPSPTFYFPFLFLQNVKRIVLSIYLKKTVQLELLWQKFHVVTDKMSKLINSTINFCFLVVCKRCLCEAITYQLRWKLWSIVTFTKQLTCSLKKIFITFFYCIHNQLPWLSTSI